MEDAVDRILEQWHAERPDLDASPMGVVGRITRANALLGQGLKENFARDGLERWEFDVLATLRRHGQGAELTAGALGAASMMSSGAITNRIDRLVARGLVAREVNPDSRRQVLISLTGAGRDLVDAVVPGHVETERELLAGLSAREQKLLADLLRKLLLAQGDAGPGS